MTQDVMKHQDWQNNLRGCVVRRELKLSITAKVPEGRHMVIMSSVMTKYKHPLLIFEIEYNLQNTVAQKD